MSSFFVLGALFSVGMLFVWMVRPETVVQWNNNNTKRKKKQPKKEEVFILLKHKIPLNIISLDLVYNKVFLCFYLFMFFFSLVSCLYFFLYTRQKSLKLFSYIFFSKILLRFSPFFPLKNVSICPFGTLFANFRFSFAGTYITCFALFCHIFKWNEFLGKCTYLRNILQSYIFMHTASFPSGFALFVVIDVSGSVNFLLYGLYFQC